MHSPTSESGALEACRVSQKITRGVRRLLASTGNATVCELTLPNGRRADIVALSASGRVTIIEVKSSAADFRTDMKWPEYLDYCDRFYFALAPDGPANLIPVDVGLILADAYGGDFVRHAPDIAMAGPRRRSVLISFARHAAHQLHATQDSELNRLVST